MINSIPANYAQGHAHVGLTNWCLNKMADKYVDELFMPLATNIYRCILIKVFAQFISWAQIDIKFFNGFGNDVVQNRQQVTT